VQAFVRKEVHLKRQIRHWAALTFPIRFILFCRVFKKRFAIKVIKAFASECAVAPYVYTIKKFSERVTKCVWHVRSFVMVTLARRKMIKRLWEKIEYSIRKRRDIAEKKEAKRLKAEMEQRLLQNASAAGKRQKQSIHAQWLQQEAEVRQILVRSDLIQKQHRSSLRTIGAVLGEGEIDDVENSPVKSKKKVIEEFDKVPSDVVDRIIAEQLALKRAAHVHNVVTEAKRKASQRGVVDTKDVKKLLLDQRFGNGAAAIEAIEEIQLRGLNRVSDIVRSDFEEHPLFMPLFGKNLGQSWNSIIEEAVNADIKSKM